MKARATARLAGGLGNVFPHHAKRTPTAALVWAMKNLERISERAESNEYAMRDAQRHVSRLYVHGEERDDESERANSERHNHVHETFAVLIGVPKSKK